MSKDPTAAFLALQQTTARPGNKSLSQSVSRASSPSRPPVRAQPPPTVSQQLSRNVSTTHHQQVSAPIETHPRKSLDALEKRDVGGVVWARTASSSVQPPQRVLQRARTSGSSSPAPLPVVPQEVKKTSEADPIQHRVFIGNMQRFNTIEISPQTRAGDVLDLVEAQGELRGETAAEVGGWMLWEIAQDFGMGMIHCSSWNVAHSAIQNDHCVISSSLPRYMHHGTATRD